MLEPCVGFLLFLALLVVTRGRTTPLFIAWLATSPLLSFWARFPWEKSVLTFDRLMVGCLILSFLCEASARRVPGGFRAGLFEIVWVVFAVFVILDLSLRGGSQLFAWKTGIDGFVLPLAVLVIARQGVDIKQLGNRSVLALSLLTVFLVLVGLVELITHQDLMVYAGSNLYREGMVRVNGPFLADHSYALISVLIGLWLWYWPRISPVTLSPTVQNIRQAASLLALCASALPFFRAVWATAVGCALLPAFWSGSTVRRRQLILGSTVMAGVLAGGTLVLSQTSFFQERVANPDNLYTRLATYQAAWIMFEDNWLTGVGLTRYTDEYNRTYYNEDDYNRKYPTVHGETPRNSPHNTLLAIWAELGLVAGTLYGLAFLLLLLEGYFMSQSSVASVRQAGQLLVTLWIAYWIPGLLLASGYYADLNFYFFALCGLLLGRKRDLHEPVLEGKVETTPLQAGTQFA
ncbi:MAG TPA: O-antigen ligase family protein [Acidobacteriota bacterium]|nr:O-antigen ligase family protein [Acidobacteriota bacterium]